MKNIITVGGLSAAIGIASLSGCSNMGTSNSPHDERSEGRVVDDKNITKAVESKLKGEPTYKFDTVEVKTFGGVVQLSGFVNNAEQSQRAEQIARGVSGATQVINGLAIKPGAIPTATGRPSGQLQSSPPDASTTSTNLTNPNN
jgi:osmotically-inducible protein OsmY